MEKNLSHICLERNLHPDLLKELSNFHACIYVYP